MIPDQEIHSTNGLAPLITGIVRDAQALIGQELRLFKSDVKKDLDQTKKAAASLITGVAVVLLAGFCLCMAAVHLVVWVWPPIPSFAAYGVLGCILAVIGGCLIWIGKSQIHATDFPAEKPVKNSKESVQWTSKR